MKLRLFLITAALALAHEAGADEYFTGLEGRVSYRVLPYVKVRMAGVVVQHVDWSCASASMAMMLDEKFDIQVPEQVLFDAVVAPLAKNPEALQAIEQKGMSIRHFGQMVQAIDLQVQGVTRTVEGLVSKEPLPVLARITEPNRQNPNEMLDHWVVIRGVHGNRVLVRDPILGNRRIPLPAFAKAWASESGKGVLVRVTRATPIGATATLTTATHPESPTSDPIGVKQ